MPPCPLLWIAQPLARWHRPHADCGSAPGCGARHRLDQSLQPDTRWTTAAWGCRRHGPARPGRSGASAARCRLAPMLVVVPGSPSARVRHGCWRDQEHRPRGMRPASRAWRIAPQSGAVARHPFRCGAAARRFLHGQWWSSRKAIASHRFRLRRPAQPRPAWRVPGFRCRCR